MMTTAPMAWLIFNWWLTKVRNNSHKYHQPTQSSDDAQRQDDAQPQGPAGGVATASTCKSKINTCLNVQVSVATCTCNCLCAVCVCVCVCVCL